MSRHNEQAAQSPISEAHQEKLRLLGEVIERERDELLNDIALQLWRSGLTDSAGLESLANEVLQETVVQATKIASKFNPEGEALLWLKAIATRVVFRVRKRKSREKSRFTPVGDTQPVRRAGAESQSEEEMFEILLTARGQHSGIQSLTAEEILSLIEGDDRKILRLYYVEGLDGGELAAEFGTSIGAIHQRLSRARIKLIKAYRKSEN